MDTRRSHPSPCRRPAALLFVCGLLGTAVFVGAAALDVPLTAGGASPAIGPAAAGGGAAEVVSPAGGGPAFGEEIDVRVINLEAVVTDARGKRVTGLRPGDFRLLVDGEEVPIDYFTEVAGGRAIAGTGGTGTQGESRAVQAAGGFATGEEVGTSYLVFVDDRFAIKADRDVVLEKLSGQLSVLGPADRMAIVSFDGSRLKLVTGWSSSPAELRTAIQSEIARPARGLSIALSHPGIDEVFNERARQLDTFSPLRPFALRGGTDPARNLAVPDGDESLFFQSQAGTWQAESYLGRVAEAAASAMRGFAFAPGRKALLFLAGGWPVPDAWSVLGRPGLPPLRPSPASTYGSTLRPVVETANLLGYTIYPVDVPGEAPVRCTYASALGINCADDALRLLASATGGDAILLRDHLQALSTAAADTRSYYWLGFSPTWQGDDQRHEVKIEVARPGLVARARDSFLDLSQRARRDFTAESAMLFGQAAGIRTVPLRLGKAVSDGWGKMKVPVTLDIPADAITMVRNDGRYEGQVEIHMLSRDAHGYRSEMPVVPLRLSSRQAPAKGQVVRYEGELEVRRTSQHISVAVLDPVTSHTTLAEADFKP